MKHKLVQLDTGNNIEVKYYKSENKNATLIFGAYS